MNIHYVTGVTGSGKTTAAMQHIIRNPTSNFFIALPSVSAIDEKRDEFYAMLDAIGQKRSVKVFYSRRGQELSVVEQIARHVEQVPRDGGSVIFISHRAFMMLPHWYHKDRWHGIIDEIPAVTYSFSESLPDNRHLLLDKLHLSPSREYPDHCVVDAADHDQIKYIAVNKKNDRVTAIFQDLAEKLMPTSAWQVYWQSEQIERFRSGEISKPTLHGLMRATRFDGFGSMTIMGADFTDSIFYHAFVKQGVEFRPNRPITALMRQHCAAIGKCADRHSNGKRVIVLRLTDRTWSKHLRDMQVEHEGHEYDVMSLFKQGINKATKGIPKLWLANRDIQNAFIDGTRLSGSPQCFNQFQDYNCCVMLSALLADKSHGAFLQMVTGMTNRQIRRAIGSQIAYQAMGRGSIRKMDSDEPFLFICPDKDTSDDIIEKYQGAATGFLLDYDPVPAQKPRAGGPKPKYATEEERRQARREQTKLANRRYRVSTNSSLQVQLRTCVDSSDNATEGTDLCGVSETLKDMAARQKLELASLWPEMEGIGGFAISNWKHKASAECLGSDPFMPTAMFGKRLKLWQGWEYRKKDEVPLFSTSLFATELDPNHSRGKANSLIVRGVVLDFENSAIQPAELPLLFPDLQMFVYSSFNHTEHAPRYRVCIPATAYVTPEVHEVVCRVFERRLMARGYDKEKHPHGLDISKFDRTSLFHRPSHRTEMFLTEHTSGRQPLDPYQWIATAPDEVWLDARLAEPVPEAPAEAPAPLALDIDRKNAGLARYALNKWHEEGGTPGGHKKFWHLARRLRDAGLARYDVEQHLRNAAMFAHNVRERQSEIEANLKSLFG